ncbi:MAG: alpha/beta hydrolase fold domain-containing protein [Solirubrobacterales bacterium]|nr:alpha/beta hydrolase fold domain-containing protein [Solirubrobacterales bacterium]MCB0870806.1 alpha/beta hydrolase fold domain-containing protein [Solirubrobacterales bacterium]
MPFGYLIAVILIGTCVLFQLIPVPRNPLLRVASFWTGIVVNEQPHFFALVLAFSTGLAFSQGDIDSAPAWGTVVLALIVVAGLFVLLFRSMRSPDQVQGAIASLDPDAVRETATRPRLLPALLGPLAYGRRRVTRIADISYGPAGERNLLDLYLPRSGEVTGPTLIYLHGGGFKSGSKRREGQLALHRLAGKGWVCISANYRLSPESQFPDYPIDLKRVIAWAKDEGVSHGVNPDRILLAGSSAGGHIAATAALTANEPLLQPGFEQVDTSVAGAIGLYGYYGGLEYGSLRPRGPLPSSPRDLIHAGAPPFLVIHGDRDTVVSFGIARSFVSRLRDAGVPVAFARLPGAQHTFDLLRSIRNESSVAAIEDFAGWIFGATMEFHGESGNHREAPVGAGSGHASGDDCSGTGDPGHR